MSKQPDPMVELAEAVLRRVKDREELVPLRDEDGACIECDATEGHEVGCVLKTAEEEIDRCKAEWVDVVSKIAPAQKVYDDAVAAESKYNNYDKPLPEKIAKATDHALSSLHAWMDRKVVLEHTIKRLQSPAEIERRREVNNRIREVKKVAAENNKKETARDQGVPGSYLGANGNFKPGMDARYKSDLITSALGEKITDKGLHQFTKESALERLQQRGWMSHLEKAKKSREDKAAKKAAAAREKAKATPARRSTRTATKKTAASSKRKGTSSRKSTTKA